jgi:hypothetical protein
VGAGIGDTAEEFFWLDAILQHEITRHGLPM